MRKEMNGRKRERGDGGFSSNGGFVKKTKKELESLSTGVGSKLKPCTKYFSTAGCPFGENCHFLHYVPGGYNAVAQMMNLGPPISPVSRTVATPSSFTNGSTATTKTRLCSKYNTVEGCKYGDKCNFAHGEWELRRPIPSSHNDPRAGGAHHPGWHAPPRMEPTPTVPASSFGASATAKISVAATLAGAIIGKGGVNSKQIFRQTGARLSIREHERDPNLKNIELEGTFEQIGEASAVVRELIGSLSSAASFKKPTGGGGQEGKHHPGNNYKTKLCDNFAKGKCTFGERCHFAHGETELRGPLGVM